MDENHGNIHGQEGKVYLSKKKEKKNLTLRDAIIGIITVALVAHFGTKFFDDSKKELVSMSAISDLQIILQNVKNHYITLGALGANTKEAFWTTAGVPLNALPWWSVCFEIGLETSKDVKIVLSKTTSDFTNDEKCQALYIEPQVIGWLNAPIYITNKKSDNNASANEEEDLFNFK